MSETLKTLGITVAFKTLKTLVMNMFVTLTCFLCCVGNDRNHDAPRTDKVEPIQETTVNSGDENARALGTFGYDAPEYAMSGKLNSKSALHSLGVIVQKFLAEKKPFDHTLTSGQQSLVSRAIPKAVAMYVRYEEAVFRPNMNIHKLCNLF